MPLQLAVHGKSDQLLIVGKNGVLVPRGNSPSLPHGSCPLRHLLCTRQIALGSSQEEAVQSSARGYSVKVDKVLAIFTDIHTLQVTRTCAVNLFCEADWALADWFSLLGHNRELLLF